MSSINHFSHGHFLSFSSLIADDNKIERPFICNECSKAFRSGGHLREHVEGVHEKLRYRCNFCPNFFYHERKLRKHLVERHTPSSEAGNSVLNIEPNSLSVLANPNGQPNTY